MTDTRYLTQVLSEMHDEETGARRPTGYYEVEASRKDIAVDGAVSCGGEVTIQEQIAKQENSSTGPVDFPSSLHLPEHEMTSTLNVKGPPSMPIEWMGTRVGLKLLAP